MEFCIYIAELFFSVIVWWWSSMCDFGSWSPETWIFFVTSDARYLYMGYRAYILIGFLVCEDNSLILPSVGYFAKILSSRHLPSRCSGKGPEGSQSCVPYLIRRAPARAHSAAWVVSRISYGKLRRAHILRALFRFAFPFPVKLLAHFRAGAGQSRLGAFPR